MPDRGLTRGGGIGGENIDLAEFSGNHGVSFVIVGVFKSAEAAGKAAAELRSILRTIAEWREDPNNPKKDDPEEYEGIPPTPPEIRLAEQYQVEWGDYAIDWIHSSEEADGHVVVLDNLVFVTPRTNETWLGAKPFDALVRRLGGRVSVGGGASEAYATHLITVTGRAPDEATAEAIRDEIATYFADPLYRRIPWKAYPPERRLEIRVGDKSESVEFTLEEWIAAEDWYRALEKAQQKARMHFYQQSAEGQELMRKTQRAFSRGDRMATQALQAERMRKEAEIPEVAEIRRIHTSTDPEVAKRYSLALQASIIGDNYFAYGGHVERDGLEITIRDIEFYYLALAHGLPALLDYLRDKGCTDITYRLKEVGRRW